jgi:arylsulfatase
MNGYDRATTPQLDAILQAGFYFERAVSPIARTTPALASLFTGSYPHTTGVRTLTDTLSDDVTTLTETLKQAGYQTTAVVSNKVLPTERGLHRGFDHYDMAADHRAARATTDAATAALRELDPGRPTFAWVHYIDPHAPYHTEPAIAASMDPSYTGRFRFHFGWHRQPGEPPGAHRTFPEDLPKGVATHDNPLPESVNAHIRRLYAADIRALDDQVGRLIASARAQLGDNLIVVFTADHGESLGEHDFYFDHGDYVYNAGTRVPLAIVLPESHPLHGSGRCRQWVSLVDVAPTVLELLDQAALDDQIEGRSLVPCLQGRPLGEAPVFSESGYAFYFDRVQGRERNGVEGRFRSVILGDWKLIWTPFRSDADAWQLYNVRDDPDETRNLYRADHPAVGSLQSELTSWLERQPSEPSRRSMTEQDVRALRELGYLEAQ